MYFISLVDIDTYYITIHVISISSLGPSDAYIYALVKCAWTAPNHYLNQCWNIVHWILGTKLQWNRNWNIFFEINTLENVVCERLSISSRPQCHDIAVYGMKKHDDIGDPHKWGLGVQLGQIILSVSFALLYTYIKCAHQICIAQKGIAKELGRAAGSPLSGEVDWRLGHG